MQGTVTPPHHELLQQLDWVRALAARLVFDQSYRDDLAQEIWHAALKAPNAAAAHPAPLRAWLTGIARHLAALLYRRDTRRTRRELAAANTRTAKSAAEVAEHAELQQRLLAAVNALPESMRDVVLLRYLEGLTPRAIAAKLQVPIATVRTRLQRAMERLRERLDADFGDRRAWALAFAALGRPRDVAAAAGAFTTSIHVLIALMKTHKVATTFAAALLLAMIPTGLLLAGPSFPAPPDYSKAVPVAGLFAETAEPRDVQAPASVARTEAPRDRAKFGGRVVDTAGAPIAGATVSLWPDFDAEGMRDEGATGAQVATTSALDGTFSLAPLRHEKWGIHVAARHDDHVPLNEGTICRPDEPATLVMLRVHTVPLTVEVRDRRTGVPAPRFCVVGTTALRAPGEPVDGTVRSRRPLQAPDRGVGVDGVFHGTARFVEGLPFDVLVECPGDGRDGFGDGKDPIPRTTLQPQIGEAIHLRFTVAFDLAEEQAKVVQRGRVVDAHSGAPIAGAKIGWTRILRERIPEGVSYRSVHRRYVQSRADGSFAIALHDDDGADTLRVEHDDHQTLLVSLDPSAELTLRLGPLASLRCRVVDGDGVPVAGAPLLIKAESDDVFGVGYFQERRRTDAAGVVELRGLQARSYYVNVLRRYSDADDDALTSVTYRIHAGEALDVTLATAAADAVRVIGSIVGGPDGLAPMFVPHAGERRWIRGRTDGRSYDAGGVRRGQYLVLLLPADDSKRTAFLLPRIVVDQLATQVIDLLVPSGIARGRVVSQRADRADLRVLTVPEVPPDGLAAELLGNTKLTEVLGVPLADDGSFELAHVADGRWLLQVRSGATVIAQRAITVQGSLDAGDWSID